ncbi:hypothetical protein, partial [Delftia acidovorans]|uniref:hypothetical protein n=1 Tax=Delftia acidovorans TaxID=80866 RepID=UPI001C0C4241
FQVLAGNSVEVRVLSWAPSLTTTCRGCGELRNYLQQKAVPWLHGLADDSLKKKSKIGMLLQKMQ